ncbi:hypothetical protein BK026_14095 [Alteromonas sp. V450]|nr:hypothetical protein BK026_14095 [Alteromonas sp. V450]
MAKPLQFAQGWKSFGKAFTRLTWMRIQRCVISAQLCVIAKREFGKTRQVKKLSAFFASAP